MGSLRENATPLSFGYYSGLRILLCFVAANRSGQEPSEKTSSTNAFIYTHITRLRQIYSMLLRMYEQCSSSHGVFFFFIIIIQITHGPVPPSGDQQITCSSAARYCHETRTPTHCNHGSRTTTNRFPGGPDRRGLPENCRVLQRPSRRQCDSNSAHPVQTYAITCISRY